MENWCRSRKPTRVSRTTRLQKWTSGFAAIRENVSARFGMSNRSTFSSLALRASPRRQGTGLASRFDSHACSAGAPTRKPKRRIPSITSGAFSKGRARRGDSSNDRAAAGSTADPVRHRGGGGGTGQHASRAIQLSRPTPVGDIDRRDTRAPRFRCRARAEARRARSPPRRSDALTARACDRPLRARWAAHARRWTRLEMGDRQRSPAARPDRNRSRISPSTRVGGGAPANPGALFPYDPNHQTFVNVYERGVLTTQQVLSAARPEMEYYTGGRQGAAAVFTEFTAAGIHHIAIGPDHILFIV